MPKAEKAAAATSTAFDADVAAATNKPATFDLLGQTWVLEAKPNPLLLAELARADESDDLADQVVYVDFFQVTLGRSQYQRFRRAFYDAGDEADFSEAIRAVMEAAFGRPTS